VSATTPAPAPTRETFLGIAKGVIDLAALWIAFGYLSVRAFCNFAGIPLISGLGLERYLEETYYLLVSTALNVFTSLAFLLVTLACGVLALVLPRVTRWRRDGEGHSALSGHATATIMVVCMFVCAFGFGQINRYLDRAPFDVISGPLDSKNLQDGTVAPLLWTALLAVFGLISCSFLHPGRLAPMSRLANIARAFVFGVLCVFSALLVFYVPIVFGASLRDRQVYIVRMQIEGEAAPVCGARMLESSSQILYWTAANKAGQTKVVAQSKVNAIDYQSTARLLELARQAALSPAAQPQCTPTPSGGAT
jgi:hypothetical protein